MNNEAASAATRQKKSINIKVRMILMAAISLVLMLVINLVSFLGLQSVQRNQIDSREHTKIHERLTDVIANMTLLEGYQETAIGYSSVRDNARTPVEAAAIQEESDDDDMNWRRLVDDTQDGIDKIISSVRTPAGRQHAQAVAQVQADYKPTHQAMLQLSHDSSPEAAAKMNELLARNVWEKYENAKKALVDFEIMDEKLLREVRDESVSLSTTVMVVSRLALLATVMILSLIALVVIRYVQRSITLIVKDVDTLRDGNLSQHLQPLSIDELGKTAVTLNEADETLHSMILSTVSSSERINTSTGALNKAGEQVAVGAEEVDSASSMMAAAAKEIATSVQTVTAGAEEMGASIREVSSNASEAAKVAQEASKLAEQTSATIAKLDNSSKEIGEVIKAITSIAEQTDLLTLNAIIEVARTGDADKGFAVVTREVKNLASDTGNATSKIGDKTAQIQADIEKAVIAIGGITNIISSTDDYQTTIATAVKEQTATANEVSRSVSEAAGGMFQISGSITFLTQTAKDNRTAVDGMNEQFVQLRVASGSLKKQAEAFKL